MTDIELEGTATLEVWILETGEWIFVRRFNADEHEEVQQALNRWKRKGVRAIAVSAVLTRKHLSWMKAE